MKGINFWRKKKLPIDFSNDKISRLIEKTDLLEKVLIKNGLDYHVDYLSQIRLAAENKNELEFKKLVISNKLFGGSGALWEIHIENLNEYEKFNKHFFDYVELLIQMGIRNRCVKQTLKMMPKLLKHT